MILFGATVLCLFSMVVARGPRASDDVDVWIDPLQARALLCRGATLDIVRNGQPQPILEKLRDKHTTIPAEVSTVNITWRASPGFSYSIHGRTARTEILGNPTINIPPSGVIPTTESVFQVGFPCTGRKSGVAVGRLTIKIWDATKRQIPASPLKIHVQKQCEKKVTPCHPPCAYGARCADDGVCECPSGYYGTACENALCIPHCFNGGKCGEPNVCLCPPGFSGHRCQTADVCPDNCSNHGQCVAPNTCVCRHGWSGAKCEISQGE
ncbi:wnt inhibitory factor 1-like [Diadema antillarum]|uniref:wnt inhibitory factor 1-like n=1 Tax=Diadema antillarum TaxID=105358 RepID=UPI003A898490